MASKPKRSSPRPRRRAAPSISLARAARLYQLVHLLDSGPRTRSVILNSLQIGLRTFYREIELLRRLGVQVRLIHKDYALRRPATDAETRLPFPDPQLTFAEMRELAQAPGPVGTRLAALYAEVLQLAAPDQPPRTRKPRSRGASRDPQ